MTKPAYLILYLISGKKIQNRLIKDDIETVIVDIYDLTLASFICETISVLFACCVTALVRSECQKSKVVIMCPNLIKFALIFATLVLDLWTVALINDNNVSQIFDKMVHNNCYTRDSERDITDLASNLEQVLTFGAIEAVIDFLAIAFDLCSYGLGGFEETSGIIFFAIHCVGIFFDIIISAVNFFGYVIPAFDVYNQQSDLDSRCYSFSYETNIDSDDTIVSTSIPINGTNATISQIFGKNNNQHDLIWQEITMVVLVSIAGCGFLMTCFGVGWEVCPDDPCKVFQGDPCKNFPRDPCMSVMGFASMFFVVLLLCMVGGLLLVFLVEPWLVIAFVVLFFALCYCGIYALCRA